SDLKTTKTILFIHGVWMTLKCWNKFIPYFEQLGYTCIAPPWPYKDRPIEDQRDNPDKKFGKLGVKEIVDHYADIIENLDEQPIIIGHSFGGLVTQILLDRGYGSCGIAIDSAPPAGVFSFYPSTVKGLLWITLNPFSSRKVKTQSLKRFKYSFVNKLSEDEQERVYQEFVVLETARIFFQGLYAPFLKIMKINFQNIDRKPLLMIAGGADNLIPARMTRSNHKKYQKSVTKTDYKEFEGKCHWIIQQDGWEEVAEYTHNWIKEALDISSSIAT
ncbi:MAG: alpha/beta hydrolase, partial [Candidatus Heimdallarchaeota archaeon]|nr:alpha/beta hydrolase [Candidatus Heimdallarchaeota archaeon]